MEKFEELESIFEKYGITSIKEVQSDKKFLQVKTYQVDLNIGETIYRDKLVKNNNDGSACIIVPMFDNNDVLMVVQPRVFSSRGVLLDFPSGYVENGEDPLNAALRELEEESGYKANKITKLATYYQDEGISDAIINIFLATDLEKVGDLKLDKDEFLENYRTSFDSLDELIEKGYIRSGGAQLAICKIKLLRGE